MVCYGNDKCYFRMINFPKKWDSDATFIVENIEIVRLVLSPPKSVST